MGRAEPLLHWRLDLPIDERLADTVRKCRRLPPEKIIAELYQAVLGFANGTMQKDDLTAVVIKGVATRATKRENQVQVESGV